MIDLNYISITEAIIATVIGAAIIGFFTWIFLKKRTESNLKEVSRKQSLKDGNNITNNYYYGDTALVERKKIVTAERLEITSEVTKTTLLKKLNEFEHHLSEFKKVLQKPEPSSTINKDTPKNEGN